MAAGDLILNILLRAQDSTSSVVKQVGQGLNNLASSATGLNKAAGQANGGIGALAAGAMDVAGGALTAVVGAGVAASGALVGIGESATKAAADYQQTMNQVQALAGVSAQDAQTASAAIMKMATDLGQSPKTLADGLYYIASAGYDAKDSLNLLELSTKAASVGNTSTEVTANALTAALKAFGFPASDAAKIMDEMTKTVSTGKTEFEDYANVVGKISINAKQAGVTFEEANAAFATLTNVMPSSKQAADSLNALMQTSSRIDLLTSRAKALGISFDENAYKSMNFEQRLQYLMKITGGSQEEMTKLLGRQNAVAAATALATGKFKDYNDALQGISNSSGALNQAWEKTASGFNIQVGRVKAAIDVVLIAIGNQLLPILTEIAKFVAPVIAQFGQWISASNGAGNAVASFGNKVSEIFNNIAPLLNVTWGYLKDIFKQIGDAVTLVFNHDFKDAGANAEAFAKGAVLAFNDILHTIDELLDPIVNKVLPAFLKLRDAVNNDLSAAFKAFGGIIGGDLQKNFGSLDQAASHLVPGIEAIGDGMSKAADYIGQLQPVFEEIGTYLGNTFSPVIDELTSEFNDRVKPAWEQFVASIGPAMPALKFLAEVFGVILVVSLKYFAQAAADSIKLGIDVVGLLIAGLLNMGQSFMDLLAFASKAWNAIVGVWNAAPGFFNNIWNVIKKAFGDAWKWVSDQATGAWKWVTNAWGAAGKWFQDIGKAIQKGIGDAWTWIQNTSKQAWAAIVKAVTKPIDDIIASFKWLYDHNYYFHDLIEAIKKAFHDGIQAIEDNWNGAITWLTKLWQQTSQQASDLWQKISQAIQQKIGEAGKFIQDQWGRLSGWLSQQWSNLSKSAQQAWDSVAKVFNSVWSSISNALNSLWKNISQWWTTTQTQSQKSADATWKSVGTAFSNAWNTYISKPLTTLGTNIGNWFTTQGNNFKKWADTMLRQFGDGITGGFHYVTTAITNLGNDIAKLLGFHSPPPSGPLATSDQWMPNMMKMFALGIQNNIAQITKSVTDIANEIKKILGIPTAAPTGGAQTGPLATAGTWMTNLTTKFANGITAGTPTVTTAINNLALTISSKFTGLNSTVNTSTNNINNQLTLLSTNVGTQTNNVSTQFATLNTNVTTATSNINNSIGQLNTNVSSGLSNVGTQANQASQQVQQAGQQISSSAQGASSDINNASSSIKTTFGQTSQYSTQTVQQISKSAQDAQQKWQYAQQEMSYSLQRFGDAFAASAKGQGQKAGAAFQDAFNQFGQAAVASAQAFASQIAAMLGHSKPIEGPLKDDDLWGKHMMENIVGGMTGSMPLVRSATNAIAGTLAGVNITSSASPSSARYATPSSSQPMIIYNVLDGKKISKTVTSWQARELRVQGVIRGA